MKTVRKQIAEAIVAQLLEFERACCMCEKEFGVQPRPNVSHGYCKRHLIQMQKQVLKMAAERGNQPAMQTAQQRIRAVQQRPDTDFPPDLSQQRQAAPV